MADPFRPRITIGMPVYNGGELLQQVVESLLSQTCREFKLVISDNASTDGTEETCRRFAARDPRIVYVRQPSNIGAEGNFQYVLSQADTDYFMWAAADDFRSAEFLDENVRFLDQHPEYVGSTCPVRFEDGQYDPVLMGDATRDESEPLERILGFFGVWHANGRFYSLFRTGVLRDIEIASQNFLGSDWSIIVELLRRGKMKRLDRGYVQLGRHGASNSLEIFARYRTRWVCWCLPFYEFSRRVSRTFSGAPLSQKARLARALFRLNLTAFRWQLRYELKKRYSNRTPAVAA